jgi:hypothetical protein
MARGGGVMTRAKKTRKRIPPDGVYVVGKRMYVDGTGHTIRSVHSMRSFPTHFRFDRYLMERICPHGVGHPDPDDPQSAIDGVHGCDGCCR